MKNIRPQKLAKQLILNGVLLTGVKKKLTINELKLLKIRWKQEKLWLFDKAGSVLIEKRHKGCIRNTKYRSWLDVLENSKVVYDQTSNKKIRSIFC